MYEIGSTFSQLVNPTLPDLSRHRRLTSSWRPIVGSMWTAKGHVHLLTSTRKSSCTHRRLLMGVRGTAHAHDWRVKTMRPKSIHAHRRLLDATRNRSTHTPRLLMNAMNPRSIHAHRWSLDAIRSRSRHCNGNLLHAAAS